MLDIDQIENKISSESHLSKDDLRKESLRIYLRSKIKKMKIEKLDILKRYQANTRHDLEKMIKNDETVGHPAWEDLIHLENLENSIQLIINDIETLQ